MGSDQSTEEKDDNLREVIDTRGLTKIRQEHNQKYGDITIWENNETKRKVAITNQVMHDQQAHTKAEQECMRLMHLDHDSIVKLINVASQQSDNFCSSYWQLSLLYEYLDNDLKHDMHERLASPQLIFYDESELWHIIVSVIAALAYLKSKGLSHQDIRPQSILINHEGKVKLLPKPYFSNACNNYYEILQQGFHPQQGIYLSPIQLQCLSKQELRVNHTPSKSDVFTLALVIIQCALLKPQQELDLIDFQNFMYKEENFEKCLQLVGQRYSQKLVDFLRLQLAYDENLRYDVDELFGKIEELCKDGVQVADRLFSLYVSREIPQTQSPLPILKQDSPKNFEVQKEKESSIEPVTHSASKIEQKIVQQWELDDQGLIGKPERVQRSKLFATDENVYYRSDEAKNIQGYDPRIDHSQIIIEQPSQIPLREIEQIPAPVIREKEKEPEPIRVKTEYVQHQQQQQQYTPPKDTHQDIDLLIAKYTNLGNTQRLPTQTSQNYATSAYSPKYIVQQQPIQTQVQPSFILPPNYNKSVVHSDQQKVVYTQTVRVLPNQQQQQHPPMTNVLPIDPRRSALIRDPQSQYIPNHMQSQRQVQGLNQGIHLPNQQIAQVEVLGGSPRRIQ